MHRTLKAYDCEVTKTDSSVSLFYPALDRTLTIAHESTFPFKILSWNETYVSGFGTKKEKLTTSGTLKKTIKSAYWEKHFNANSHLRDELDLK